MMFSIDGVTKRNVVPFLPSEGINQVSSSNAAWGIERNQSSIATTMWCFFRGGKETAIGGALCDSLGCIYIYIINIISLLSESRDATFEGPPVSIVVLLPSSRLRWFFFRRLHLACTSFFNLSQTLFPSSLLFYLSGFAFCLYIVLLLKMVREGEWMVVSSVVYGREWKGCVSR